MYVCAGVGGLERLERFWTLGSVVLVVAVGSGWISMYVCGGVGGIDQVDVAVDMAGDAADVAVAVGLGWISM